MPVTKTFKYAKSGAWIGGTAGSLYNFHQQLQRMSQDSNYQFNWSTLIRDTLIGVGGGASLGAGIGYIVDYLNKLEQAVDTTTVLKFSANSLKLDKSSREYREVSAKANRISYNLQRQFRHLLIKPIYRTGSTQNGTALADDFDIDIVLEFRSGTFSSTQEMYDSVYQSLYELEDNDLMKVRRQRKSIGVLFKSDTGEFKVDVVPVKRSMAFNKRTSAGYLHMESRSWFKDNSRTKTDIKALNSVCLTPMQKELLILLKNWRNNYSVPIGSHLLKSMIKDAYKCNNGKLPQDRTKKLVLVVRHIRDSIHFKKLVSVENSNNILTDISEMDKDTIYNSCKNVVQDYEYQPNSILNYFE